MKLWEKIVEKIVFYTTVFVGIAVFLLVWAICYESAGHVNINTIMKHEDLTLLYIFQQSPYGLLLGWIPAYLASLFFVLVSLSILGWVLPAVSILYPIIILLTLYFWG